MKNKGNKKQKHIRVRHEETLEETQLGKTGQQHRWPRTNTKTDEDEMNSWRHKGEQRLYIDTNERIWYMWGLVGKGQVREWNGTTLKGRNITERQELKSDMQHTRVQFQNRKQERQQMGSWRQACLDLYCYSNWPISVCSMLAWSLLFHVAMEVL